MKVLILGATGYLGLPMAEAFVRAGHTVIGQTRNPANVADLEAREIIPLVAQPLDPSTWAHVVRDVDCVVDAVGGNEIANTCTTILDCVKLEAEKSRPHGPPLSLIYASGTWVHGDSLDPPFGSRSDLTPLHTPMPLTSWRLAHERALFAAQSPSLAPNVIRPSLIYGKGGSLTTEWLASAKAGEVVYQGDREERLAMIHVDDCARAFVAVAQKALLVQGIAFDISNPYPEPASHILDQLVRASGAKGVQYQEPRDDYHRALTSSNLLRPTLARDLLGFQPRKAPFGEGMELYYKAYLASI
ncbi:NAD P-binding protein [Pseudohyphozyma bogoriensis]|nr:NAD P-binding protein [Pseudohyphozyma bogoriensis]